MIHELDVVMTMGYRETFARDGHFRARENTGRHTITLDAIVDDKALAEFGEWLAKHVPDDTVHR